MGNKTDHRSKVKICGLKSVAVAEAVGRLKPDLVGFVFSESKRKVTPEEAGTMVDAVRRTGSEALAAGVFVNPTMEQLDQTLDWVKLDVIQLHGKESPEFCASIKKRFPEILLYKVFSVSAKRGREAAAAQLEPYRGLADAVMLDTLGGGTGQTFEWGRIPEYSAWTRAAGIPLIVAGGLRPDNVAELIGRYRPDGVDVSSGVETDGEKDIKKIQAFIERVNSVDQPST